MQSSALILALLSLSPVVTVAQENAVAGVGQSPDAASLLGRKDITDEEYKMLRSAPQATSGDWIYGLSVDDSSGLTRQARTKQSRGKKPLLRTSHSYRDLCGGIKNPAQFYFGGDAYFVVKGEPSRGQYADGWISYAQKDAFGPAARAKLDFSEDTGTLYFTLDPSKLTASRSIAICPSAAAPGASGGHCTIVSLNGFERAYKFVCAAR